ncbi:hypothetical transcript [Echinococcus multilocularis]|uniref:Hypothetical transcript n=1 Tax=Echinococcus multilocularis TaxID=6211 RepID=A0A068Y2E9_ECHMU|nr:hypothetical transcript [Echinococcus multilocularis]
MAKLYVVCPYGWRFADSNNSSVLTRIRLVPVTVQTLTFLMQLVERTNRQY